LLLAVLLRRGAVLWRLLAWVGLLRRLLAGVGLLLGDEALWRGGLVEQPECKGLGFSALQLEQPLRVWLRVSNAGFGSRLSTVKVGTGTTFKVGLCGWCPLRVRRGRLTQNWCGQGKTTHCDDPKGC
jgi:hypothetical protein